jgi:hypothetical protein
MLLLWVHCSQNIKYYRLSNNEGEFSHYLRFSVVCFGKLQAIYAAS